MNYEVRGLTPKEMDREGPYRDPSTEQLTAAYFEASLDCTERTTFTEAKGGTLEKKAVD